MVSTSNRRRAARRIATAVATCAAMIASAVALAAPAQADFGLTSFTTALTDGNGVAQTQAGGHDDLTTSFRLTTRTAPNGAVVTQAQLRDFAVDLPAGFYGNPQNLPLCTPADFGDLLGGGCPLDTQVGVVRLQRAPVDGVMATEAPVYSIQPAPGQTAVLGFDVVGVNVEIAVTTRAEANNALRATSENINEGIPLYGIDLTLWGVPADPSHDAQRFPYGPAGPEMSAPSPAPKRPFLSSPARCDAPLVSMATVESWQQPGRLVTGEATMPARTGCDQLAFAPGLDLRPTLTHAGTPSGYDVELHVPQDNAISGLATPQLKTATVTLPAGVAISPASADGLGACSDAQLAQGSPDPEQCPDSAKIGTATIDTPVLGSPLQGWIYLGTQQSNDPASGDMYRIFVVAAGSGVRLKLKGSVKADPATGRLTTTFDDNPQLPFTDLRLAFDGGTRAALTAPKACGTYTTHASLTPWSGGAAVQSDSSFTIDQGCDQAGRFEPTLDAGVTDPAAGGSSPFVLSVGRPDGQQDLGAMDVTLPPGVLAHVGSVPLCPEAQAAAGSCPAASQVGTTMVAAGAGASPLSVPQAGKAPTAVYLAGPYKGAPYSLSIVVPGQAGPFDLGTVVVRAALFIDPVDAHVTVRSDPLPTILGGVPLDLQRITVSMDRPGFMVSPTSCDPLQVGARVTSAQGAAANLASRFQVAGCAALDLKPKLSLSLTGKGQTTDDKHPGLRADLTMPASGGANLKKMAVTLPLSMALDPDNSQSDALCEFVEGSKTIPNCPAGSIVGSATAVTPLLDVPLTGPVYFIKNVRTDAKTGRQIKTLPTLATVLQGAGVTLVLRATTAVVDDKLVTTFDKIPDAPVSDFKLNINGGAKGILVVSGANLCAATQVTKQAATGQNGRTANANITMSTPCALGVVASSHSASSLKVTVGGIGAGKVSVSGKGLTKTTRTIGKATTATLAPRLSQATRATLAHGHNVKVRVTVSFTPQGAKKARVAHKTLTIHGAKKR
jgi:hypothetical protein